jgi:hypothetical protein
MLNEAEKVRFVQLTEPGKNRVSNKDDGPRAIVSHKNINRITMLEGLGIIQVNVPENFNRTDPKVDDIRYDWLYMDYFRKWKKK